MPFGSGVALSTQVCVPVVQLVTPVLHGSGFVVQAPPAVQAEQTPPLHTWFVPQVVPFGMGVGPSMHVSDPVEQLVTPATQTFGFVEQAFPAVQPEHTPPLQT